jgi:hypothetical protein
MNTKFLDRLVKAAPFAMAAFSIVLLVHGVHVVPGGDVGGSTGPNFHMIASGDVGGSTGPN